MGFTYPTILIVEDEPIVRYYEAQLAEGAGFVTIEANDANEALRKLDNEETINILLTDVDMPGPVDGLELANIVRDRWPEVRIVVVSAHVDSSDPGTRDEIVYLRKPFTQEELVSTLLGVV